MPGCIAESPRRRNSPRRQLRPSRRSRTSPADAGSRIALDQLITDPSSADLGRLSRDGLEPDCAESFPAPGAPLDHVLWHDGLLFAVGPDRPVAGATVSLAQLPRFECRPPVLRYHGTAMSRHEADDRQSKQLGDGHRRGSWSRRSRRLPGHELVPVTTKGGPEHRLRLGDYTRAPT